MIELDHMLIGVAHLKVDLAAAVRVQNFFHLSDDRPRVATALMIGIDADEIEPAAMSIPSRHDTRDNLAIDFADEKQPIVLSQFSLNIQVRIVPWPQQIAAPPQFDHGRFVVGMEGANSHFDKLCDLSEAGEHFPGGALPAGQCAGDRAGLA